MLDRPTLPPTDAVLPMVSIHVPVCDPSPGQVRRTLARLASLGYPALEVLVVDYNTADPKLWEEVASDCARLDARFRFFHLGRWPGGQAGALNFARTQTAYRAEFIAVLDDDVIVPQDWLNGVVAEFADPWIGAVRFPYIVRKDALDGVGGWAEWCVDEAAALDLALLQKRWHLARPSQEVVRDAVDFDTYRQRTARLAYGAAQIGRRYWRTLFSPFDRELTLRQRWSVVAGTLPWIADALSLAALTLSLALSIGLAGTLLRSVAPAIVCSLLSVVPLTLRLAHIRGAGFRRAIVGLALSHAAGRAIWSVILNRAPPGLHAGRMREEPALLLLIWAALAGVAHAGVATWQAKLWCTTLLLQSLPYLAAVLVAALAAMPAWQPTLQRTDFGPVARTGAGD